MHVCVYATCVRVSMKEEGVKHPEARVTGEQPYAGAGNQTLVLWGSRKPS